MRLGVFDGVKKLGEVDVVSGEIYTDVNKTVLQQVTREARKLIATNYELLSDLPSRLKWWQVSFIIRFVVAAERAKLKVILNDKQIAICKRYCNYN